MAFGVLNISGDVALTVLGAIAVSTITALITAKTTNRRLDKQLRAEKHRNDAQLEAENARQMQQLAHDRELSDLGELRDLLDETSQLLSRVVKTAAQVAGGWKRRDDENAQERLEGHRQSLRNEVVEIVESHQRIMLRLPRDSEVSKCLNEVRKRIYRLHELSRGNLSADADAVDMEKGIPATEIADAHVQFLDSARKLVASQLPAEENAEGQLRAPTRDT